MTKANATKTNEVKEMPVKKLAKAITTESLIKNAESKIRAVEGDLDNFKVFKTGGKQYIAKSGLKIRIEKIVGEFKEGDTITFDEVLMTSDAGKVEVGMPLIAGAKVQAKLLEIGRDEKKMVVKYKAKSRYYKKNGHRQPRFIVEII